MRRSLSWLILVFILAACGTQQAATLSNYGRVSDARKPMRITPTPQIVAANTIIEMATPTLIPDELIEPVSVNFNAVIAPATFAASAVPTVTPTFTPTFTVTPSPTITSTRTPYRVPTAFPEHEEALYSHITYDESRALLFDTPLLVIPEEHVRQIFGRGQVGGLNQQFLLTVGDCNSESHWYLQSLLDDTPPEGDGVDRSFYQDIAVQSMIEDYRDAFAFKGQSVNSGLNALSVMDPFWANPNLCPPGASPLDCDYQQKRPFASLIMFGANDIKVLNTAGYEMALRDIIEFTLHRDIIPILSTFTVRPLNDGTFEQGVRFNGVVVKLAEEYNIPLINFWLAAREVDGYGILDDNAHMTVPGFNIRNRLTLDMLNTIRRDILLIGDEF